VTGPRAADLVGPALAAGAVAALAAGPLPALLAAGGLVLLRRTPTAVALAVLVVAGALAGTARLEALARDPLAGRIGSEVVGGQATVGEAWRGTGRLRLAVGTLAGGGPVLLRLESAAPPPRGAVLRVEGRLVRPRPADDGFDEAAWLARQGVHAVLRVRRYEAVGMRGGAWGIADRLRLRALGALAGAGTADPGAVVRGLAFGADAGLSPRAVADLRASGLAHLMAVSGGNVALLVALVVLAAWALGGSRRHALVAAVAAILLYVAVVGPDPSVVRAGIAGVAGCIALLAGRPRAAWRALGLGAAGLLVWNPHSLFDPGLQLSFAAVAGILLVAPRTRALAALTRLPHVVAAAAAVTAAATLATAPISWWHFGQVALAASVPANLAAAPAVPLVLWTALAAVAVDPLAPAAAHGLAWCAQWPAAWIVLCARSGAALGAAVPGWAVAALAAAACLAAARRVGSGRGRAAPQPRLPADGDGPRQGAARRRAAARALPR